MFRLRWKTKLKQSIITVLVTSILCFASYQYALSTVPLLGPYYLDVPFSDASYYVAKFDSGLTYMIDCDTWRNTWSSTDSDAVINAALGNLTGATPKQTVHVSGSFTIDAPIQMPDYAILDLYQADLTLDDNADCHMIECRDSTDGNIMVEIWGGYLDGNQANNAAGDGIHWDCSGGSKGDVNSRYSLIVKDTYIIETVDNGIFYDSTGGGGGKYNLKLSKVTAINAKCGFNLTNAYDGFIGDDSFVISRAAGDRDIYLYAPTAMHVEGLYCGYQGLEVYLGSANIFSNIICDNSPDEGIEILGALDHSVFSDIRVSGCATSVNNTFAGISIGGTANHNVFSSIIVDQVGKSNMYTYCIEEGAGCDYNEFKSLVLEEYVTSGLRIQGANSVYDSNVGFITKNSGAVVSCYTGSWVAHGLVGDPGTTGSITLSLRGATEYNATFILRAPTVLQSNATHFQIEFNAWETAGWTQVPVTVVEAQTVYWDAVYKP